MTQINPAADPQSRQFAVRLTLNNPTGQIRPGMFARVTFVTLRIPNALQVPREAVRNDKKTGGQVVTVIDANSVAHVRPVKTGISNGADIQLLQGVQPGENVVTLSLTPVRDEQKVNAAVGGAGGNDKKGS